MGQTDMAGVSQGSPTFDLARLHGQFVLMIPAPTLNRTTAHAATWNRFKKFDKS